MPSLSRALLFPNWDKSASVLTGILLPATPTRPLVVNKQYTGEFPSIAARSPELYSRVDQQVLRTTFRAWLMKLTYLSYRTGAVNAEDLCLTNMLRHLPEGTSACS